MSKYMPKNILQQTGEAEGFLSRAELLRRLPISDATLANWMRDGSIPFIKTGRRVLFDWASVRGSLLKKQRGGIQ